jgi:Na+-driven multidrug efflux pump
VPLILSGILQLLFNAADIVVVGRFAGNHALAAVGSTSSLINLLVNLFIGLSVGANVLVAGYYGGNKNKEISVERA